MTHISDYEAFMIDKLHHLSWVMELRGIINTEKFKRLGGFVANRRRETNVFPSSDNVFRVLELAIDKVKVVVIGQDPYHDNNADGLAFSSATGEFPPSLLKIIEQVQEDYSSSFNSTLYGSLQHWADEGVFLMNKVLTVEHSARSHYNKGWEEFTGEIIKAISRKRINIVYMLWGKEAQEYEKYINPNNLILKAVHPAYACYNKIRWENEQCFFKCNEYLIKNNIEPINW